MKQQTIQKPKHTLARMRTDYVHEQQGHYRTAINDLQHRIYEEKIHHLADQMISMTLTMLRKIMAQMNIWKIEVKVFNDEIAREYRLIS